MVVLCFLEIRSELVHWDFRLDALSRSLHDVSGRAIGNACPFNIKETLTASFASVIH